MSAGGAIIYCLFLITAGLVWILEQIGIERPASLYVIGGIYGSCCLCWCCGVVAESGGDPEKATVIVKNSIRRVSFQSTKIQVSQEPAGQVSQEPPAGQVSQEPPAGQVSQGTASPAVSADAVA